LLPKAVYKNDTLQNYHIYNQYVVRVQQRDELRKFLTDNSIGTEIYYPIPFHLQECFNYLGHKKGDFTVAEFCADTSIALPIFPELSDEQINYVVDKFSEFLK
jgi:dTDP-4-amino-4,6-dideoxygalactose transaminase